ncbi:unnamed protein product [Cunninghamella blakesleeana]
MRIVLVKLGGAALTEKQTTSKLSPNFDELVEQISQVYNINLSQQIHTIFIHGAGSFGHPQAKQYQVKYGWTSSSSSNVLSSKDIKYGMTTTRQNVLLLHNHLLQRLQSHGLPIVSVSPFDHIETSGGGEYPTLSSTMKVIQRCKQLLRLGFIPLLHGDAVMDDQLGCTILSGDVIMHQLATYFDQDNNNNDNDTIERCIFVTDVDGIYTGDPKLALVENSAVSLIKHIPVPLLNINDHHNELDNNNNDNNSNNSNNSNKKDDNKIADVSGGIQGKMKWAKRIVVDSNVHQVIICKAGSPEVIHSITLMPIIINDPSFNQLSLTVFTKNE